jgi:hypothetical protein
MKYMSLLLFFISFNSSAQRLTTVGKNNDLVVNKTGNLNIPHYPKGRYDTSKIVGFICKDVNCSDGKFFRGYTVCFLPSKKENMFKDLPDDKFLDENKKVIEIIPITFYYYDWK